MIRCYLFVVSVACSLVCPTLGRAQNKVVHMNVDSEEKAAQISKVHIVFMNHLDVGYYDGLDKDVGFAVEVLNRYQTEYFVRAINMSRTLINLGYVEKFVYTTHPWLVSLYLDCPNITFLSTPLKCPNRTEQTDFIKAVYEGHIAWHAFPFNIQTDHLGARLFNFGVELSQKLDKMFEITRTHATMSQRDVPGMTKALLPVLQARGVKAISVGVNPGTAPPDVPSPFVWKFNNSDPDGIMAFWVKGGYPLNPGPYPARPIGLAKDKCVSAPGLSEVLCFAFRTDNTGPPVTVEGLKSATGVLVADHFMSFSQQYEYHPVQEAMEVLGYYEILRAEYPGAELVASTFDNFVKVLETVKSSLPVQTFEVGDTWIQGISSDPKKCSMYRAFVRAWESCAESGLCDDTDQRIQDMLRFLIKLPEHTWGAHNFLDNANWTNQELAIARQSEPFKLTENTWKEQRQFLDFALNALGDHPLSGMVQAEYKNLQATVPDLSDYVQASVGVNYQCPGGVVVQFNSNGSLNRLYDPVNKREWASASSPLGQLRYDTYVEQDFIDMAKLYNYEAGVGYDKPNLTQYAHPEKRRWEITVLSLFSKDVVKVSWEHVNNAEEQMDYYGLERMRQQWVVGGSGGRSSLRVNSTSCDFWVKATTSDNQTRTKYGAPEVFYVRYVGDINTQGLDITLLMMGKVTTRLPESISFNFSPLNLYNSAWSISKMNQSINPCEVVLNGSQYVHGVDNQGVSLLNKARKGLQILSTDVPLVFIGTTNHVDSPFPVPLQPFECSTITTMSFNLYNNIWNTNYIYWYPYIAEDADFKARFALRFV